MSAAATLDLSPSGSPSTVTLVVASPRSRRTLPSSVGMKRSGLRLR
jgi:hypothetical protein